MVEYLPFIADLFMVSGLIVGVAGFKRLLLPSRIIVLFLFVSSCIEAMGLYLVSGAGQHNNIWLYNAYILLQFLILILAGYYLAPTAASRKTLYIIIPLFFAVFAWELKTATNLELFDLSFLISCVLLTGYYLLQLTSLLRASEPVYSSIFLCLGVLIYTSCSIPAYSFFNHFTSLYGNMQEVLHSARFIVSILLYAIICSSLIVEVRKQQKVVTND